MIGIKLNQYSSPLRQHPEHKRRYTCIVHSAEGRSVQTGNIYFIQGRVQNAKSKAII